MQVPGGRKTQNGSSHIPAQAGPGRALQRIPRVEKNGHRSEEGQAEHLGWNPCSPNTVETVKCRRTAATTRDYDESEMRFKSRCNIITLTIMNICKGSKNWG